MDVPRQPETPTDTTPNGPPEQEVPSDPPETEQCANLGLVPIGDATGGDAGILAAAPRFRAMAAEILASESALVCARPIESWRDDLYVQSLRAGGTPVGILVAGRGPTDPVLRLTRYEWAGWGWRSDHNFVGVPTGRTTIDGVPVILTSRGGVVIEHPESMGIPVVNGAWEMWMVRGGPSGDMGMPAGRAQGLARIATWQDFAGGRVVLPVVETDIEAEAQPLEKYRWMPWSEFGDPNPSQVQAGSVIENAGASYYVADDGMRYWIRTTDAWFCARDAGSRMIGAVEGRVLLQFAIGGEYICGG
ncbi:MAG: hypothetical protein KF906_00115 [Actinobacteria bacterium]|nr:hypothetical protein [Actinomycetota bacterium]